MLLYRAAYRDAEQMMIPTDLLEAEAIAPGLTPVYADPSDLLVDVETPTGQVFAIDDPMLISELREEVHDAHELTLVWSDRAMTDCRPISLFSTKTAQQLGREAGD